ncbi:PREDICTED: unconventional myosin-XV-like [Charadrius vociferus]|uniref:unconventional myosin-XV-like n=1 Tax=Charadrius vociferus TaxID=50402 RepID=UPI0005216FB1|nr:PREDICTED: unconventional myosin-XV-like [Charadrius vociferus]
MVGKKGEPKKDAEAKGKGGKGKGKDGKKGKKDAPSESEETSDTELLKAEESEETEPKKGKGKKGMLKGVVVAKKPGRGKKVQLEPEEEEGESDAAPAKKNLKGTSKLVMGLAADNAKKKKGAKGAEAKRQPKESVEPAPAEEEEAAAAPKARVKRSLRSTSKLFLGFKKLGLRRPKKGQFKNTSRFFWGLQKHSTKRKKKKKNKAVLKSTSNLMVRFKRVGKKRKEAANSSPPAKPSFLLLRRGGQEEDGAYGPRRGYAKEEDGNYGFPPCYAKKEDGPYGTRHGYAKEEDRAYNPQRGYAEEDGAYGPWRGYTEEENGAYGPQHGYAEEEESYIQTPAYPAGYGFEDAVPTPYADYPGYEAEDEYGFYGGFWEDGDPPGHPYGYAELEEEGPFGSRSPLALYDPYSSDPEYGEEAYSEGGWAPHAQSSCNPYALALEEIAEAEEPEEFEEEEDEEGEYPFSILSASSLRGMRETLSSKLSLNRKFRLFPRPQVKLFGRDRLDVPLPPSPPLPRGGSGEPPSVVPGAAQPPPPVPACPQRGCGMLARILAITGCGLHGLESQVVVLGWWWGLGGMPEGLGTTLL